MVRCADPGGLQPDVQAPTADQGETSGAPTPQVSIFAAPLQVKHFLLLRLLGSGGMGAVYAAYDERLDRRVAIKLLHHTETAEAVQRQRLLREAQAMARVSHPNVVPVFEIGEAGEQVFIAMEYVEGVTLAAWARQRARTWQELLRIYMDAGQGLCAAHAVGLIHRDFKPENVLVGSDQRPRVSDFGLARLNSGSAMAMAGAPEPYSGQRQAMPVTIAGAVAGTPGYMSPEQCSGAEVDARSDQFSFCAALYEALYGQLPFSGDSLAELFANTIAGQLPPPPPGSLVPTEVYQALVRGLAVDPALRFPSMERLLSALRLEQDHTIAGANIWRRRYVNLFLGTTVVAFLFEMFRRKVQTPAVLDGLVADALTFVMWSGVGASWRRTLLRNAFHRRIWLMGTIILLQRLGMTLIGLHLRTPVLDFLALDLMGLAGSIALLAVVSLPRMWWWPPVLVGVAGVTAIYGASALWINVACHALSAGVVALAWNAAAERARRELLH